MSSVKSIRPELPSTVKLIIDSFVSEDNAEEFQDLEGFQMRMIIAEIAYDKKCLAYTMEFGCLDDCIADILAEEYKAAQIYGVIEEIFIDTWLDSINAYFRLSNQGKKDRIEAALDEEFLSKSSYYRNNDSGIQCYSDKHGE